MWQHSCGSIPNLLPYLVDAGIDAINPVQASAEGMEPKGLKEKFGADITFWGGGVDTQRTLPFGTPDEVYAEVKERIKTFAPGGALSSRQSTTSKPIHRLKTSKRCSMRFVHSEDTLLAVKCRF